MFQHVGASHSVVESSARLLGRGRLALFTATYCTVERAVYESVTILDNIILATGGQRSFTVRRSGVARGTGYCGSTPPSVCALIALPSVAPKGGFA